jgi:hypothetical protein
MKNNKNYKAEISLPYGNKINVKYIYTNSKKDEFEITYNNTSEYKVKEVESFNYLHHSELLEHNEDTVSTLEFINKLLKKTLVDYLDGRNTFNETNLLLHKLTYHLELFGSETYNGWDIDCVKEALHTTKKAALIDVLMYCIIKIHFTIKGLNKLNTK